MSSSRQQSKLQEAKAEMVSLLKGLSDKVDLERKLGVNYLQFDPSVKNNISYEEAVAPHQLTTISDAGNIDIYSAETKAELSE